jgi:hypothetical protein
MNVLSKVVFGSRLYGTSIPTSDEDFRGVYLPSKRECFLTCVQDVITDKTEDDTQYFSLQKFLRLAAEGQSVALEMLFAGPQFWVKQSPIWLELHLNRRRFLTKKMAAFVGYARTMAGKYSSRVDRLNDIVTLKKFLDPILIQGNPEAKMSTIYDAMPLVPNALKGENQFSKSSDRRFYSICGREYTVHMTIKQFYDALNAIEKEYGSRVRAAQNNEVEYKALAHAFRAAYQCRSAIRTGDITFPLLQADELRSMRLGEMNFITEKLDVRLSDLIESINAELEASDLPSQADWGWCEDFIEKAYA